jgi:transposase
MIPANHRARVVNAVIDRLDISAIEGRYKAGGTSIYHPRMLLKVITYAYLDNVYSGRRMETLLSENVAYMWLSGMNRPDFRTINLFRSKRLKGVFEGIFTQVVTMLNEEGLVSLDVQYIDGTKIESAANRYTFVWRKSVEKNKAKLEKKIRTVLAEAEEAVKSEDNGGEEDLPDEEDLKARTEMVLKKMTEAGIAKGSRRKAVEKVRDEMLPKKAEYEGHLKKMGDRNSYSKTDPDATFMRMKEDHMMNGQTKPGYNVQIATENQFVTNYGVYQRPTDQGTLIDYLESFRSKYGRQSGTVVADSGYGSEQNYEYLFGNGITPFVKYNMFHAEKKRSFRNDIFRQDNLFYNKELDFYVCPMGQRMEYVGDEARGSDLGYVSTVSIYRAKRCDGCPMRGLCHKGKGPRTIEVNHRNKKLRAKARELLDSEEGLRHRSMRPIEPEAVFGQIKFDHGFKRFRLRSLEKVSVEFGLVALAHNLRKYAEKTA